MPQESIVLGPTPEGNMGFHEMLEKAEKKYKDSPVFNKLTTLDDGELELLNNKVLNPVGYSLYELCSRSQDNAPQTVQMIEAVLSNPSQQNIESLRKLLD